MAASIGKSVAQVILVTLPFFWLTAPDRPLSRRLGADRNGCSRRVPVRGRGGHQRRLRLFDHDAARRRRGRMAATVAGFGLGVLVFVWLIGLGTVERPMPARAEARQGGQLGGGYPRGARHARRVRDGPALAAARPPAPPSAIACSPRNIGYRPAFSSASAARRSTCSSVPPATPQPSKWSSKAL